MTTTDEKDIPRINDLGTKISTLQRRRAHLRERLDEGKYSKGSESFLQAELGALDAALVALAYHRRELQGFHRPLDVLRDILAAEENGEALDVLLQRARGLLEDYAA